MTSAATRELLIGGSVIESVMERHGVGATPGSEIVRLIWEAIWSAFHAILVVVTYHELRVVKEGTDTGQIVAVFD